MKPHLKLRFLMGTLFVLLPFISCSRKTDNPYASLLLHSQTDALDVKIVLTELREGRLTNALELLEMQLDTSVIIINHSLSKVSGPERETALATLRSLKAYREAHPRQPEAVIQAGEPEDAKAIIQASEKASRILNDLK